MQSLLQRGSSLAARRMAMRSTVGVRGFAKEIKFGTEGRAAMLKGVEVLADAVQVRNLEFWVDENSKIERIILFE